MDQIQTQTKQSEKQFFEQIIEKVQSKTSEYENEITEAITEKIMSKTQDRCKCKIMEAHKCQNKIYITVVEMCFHEK